MKFTAEHEALRQTTRQFVENELNPHIPKWEAEGRFPIHDVFKKLGELGLLGICKPIDNGGSGLDYSYNLIVAEELGRAACGGVPLAIGVQTDMATPALARFGSPELREKFLNKAITGEYVAAIAVSEPHAGSDVAAIKTTAVKEGDDYIIN
ncbi:acyl-CoA dehydrogenase family protein, partial [Rhizobium hidalgonense]